MKIRAKMACSQVEKNSYGGEEIKLHAVYTGGEENKSYAKATPNASVTMTIDNTDVHGAFVVGKEYYVDFTPA